MIWPKKFTVPCDNNRRMTRKANLPTWLLGAATSVTLFLSGCGVLPGMEKSDDKSPPAGKSGPAPTTSSGKAGVSGGVKLPPPETPRTWADARQQAARRMLAANPDMTYMTKTPDILLAIPVMTIELNGDGSIRDISVMRYPSQARDTVNLAIQAIRRAAPFGNVSHLPKPWKFNETFLFNDDRKFKPMTLDKR